MASPDMSHKLNNGISVSVPEDTDDNVQKQKPSDKPKTQQKSNKDMGIFKFAIPGLSNEKAGNIDVIDEHTNDSVSDLEQGRYANTDEMFDEDEMVHNSTNLVYRIQTKTIYSCKNYSSVIWKVLTFLCLAGYTVYFGFAISNDVDKAKALIIITMVVLLLLVYVFVRDHFGDAIYDKCWGPLTEPVSKHWHIIQW